MRYLTKTFILLLLFSNIGSLMAKEFYRYRNADGHLLIIDQLNNEMLAVGYDVLSERGMLIKKVPPARTLAEEEEKRLAIIAQKQAEKDRQKQLRHDVDLLRQYSSISDIIRNRDAQLLGLTQRIRIQESKKGLLTIQLEEQQKQAANHERLGKKTPGLLKNDILITHKQIATNARGSITLEEEKIVVAAKFEKDILRYKELESLRMTKKQSSSDNKNEFKPVIYECPNNNSCIKAWQLAQVFAKDNSTGQIEIITDTLIITSKPEKDSDIALSFTRLPATDNKTQIIFEVSCKNSKQGSELCKSQEIKLMRSNYLKLINQRVN